MTCEIVAAPAAIAQMLSADRSIRGTVPRRNIITALSVTRRFFFTLPIFIYYRRWKVDYDRSSVSSIDRRIHRR